MQMLAFFLCEQVVTRMDKSLDILRFGISRVNVNTQQIPAQFALGLVCRFLFTPAEDGIHHARFIFLSPDGERLSESPQFDFNIQPDSRLWSYQGSAPFAAKQSGDHALAVVMDGHEVSRWPLRVNVISESPPAAP